MLYCVSLLEKSISKKKKKKHGRTLRKMCIWLHGQTVFTCYALFFSFGERGLCWTLNSDSARNPWALQSVFCVFFSLQIIFRMRAKERARVCLSEHSLGLQRAINIHTEWIRMGWSSELCRALIPSPLLRCTYNVKVWSDFFFLLNSIFYRFCRHFVVGRKK